MFNIYTNVNVMKNEEELASTSCGDGDEVLAIARQLIHYHGLRGATHVEIEMVLQKGVDIYYKNKSSVNKRIRISLKKETK